MRSPQSLLLSKLVPPALHPRVLRRPALLDQLRDVWNVRLAVVQAGTGYGKTTTLAALAAEADRSVWFSIEESDADPQRFLAYLIEAFRLRLPTLPETPSVVLQEHTSEGPAQGWAPTIDALINALVGVLDAPTLLVLDDFHFVAGAPGIGPLVARFVHYAPPNLHTILSTRYPVALDGMTRWRAKGELLEIDRRLLALQPEEVEVLFRETYGVNLSPDVLDALVEKTEGWPIALQLVWQRLRREPNSVEALLSDSPAALPALFAYLAHDVYDGQPPEIARFLTETAILRELRPASCEAVTGRSDARQLLARLHSQDLFVIALGDGVYRYHHLFHDFLRQHATDEAAARAGHRRASDFFRTRGESEEAVYHLLQAGAVEEAARAVEEVGEHVIHAGNLDTVAGWIDALPPHVIKAHPLLQAYLGDLYRLRSRFGEAISWYAQAERSWRARNDGAGIARALRGQALIYLDTVRPTEAEALLEEALGITEGTADHAANARLLELLAENKLNLGKPQEAEQLRADAQALRDTGPDEDVLSVRVKLRTGRLHEARDILERWIERERREAAEGTLHPPRAHRETVLLLALVYAFLGEPERAEALAHAGIALGDQMGSPFVAVVGQMRLGHARQVRQTVPFPALRRAAYEDAIACYQRAIAAGDSLSVRRTRLEAMWGLTRAYGFSGDLVSARQAADQGIEVGGWAGDAWVMALGELALGASYVLAGEPHVGTAVPLLTRLLVSFRECGDRFGRAATRLWLSLATFSQGRREHWERHIDRLFALCERERYDFLFTRSSLLGPPDPHLLVPMLLAAREVPRCHAYASRLLGTLGLSELERHPGYQLRVRTLGRFDVWRGDTEIEAEAWKRTTARQLFQFLLTMRDQPLHREEIIERLWPDRRPEAGVRDFKVALSVLNKVLEPGRAPDAPYAFIVREGATYRLRREADVWWDAARFAALGTEGLHLLNQDEGEAALPVLQAAVALYGGEYLPDARYDDWSSEARERFLSLFLRVADRLADGLLTDARYADCIAVCQRILVQDPCWEHAYRLQMQAHAAQGDIALARRVFERCQTVLDEQLGVSPSPRTVELHDALLAEA